MCIEQQWTYMPQGSKNMYAHYYSDEDVHFTVMCGAAAGADHRPLALEVIERNRALLVFDKNAEPDLRQGRPGEAAVRRLARRCSECAPENILEAQASLEDAAREEVHPLSAARKGAARTREERATREACSQVERPVCGLAGGASLLRAPRCGVWGARCAAQPVKFGTAFRRQ